MKSEQQWREAWADYFEARAAKSIENAKAYPQHTAEWVAKAGTERECAYILRCGKSLESLTAGLSGASSPEKRPVDANALTELLNGWKSDAALAGS